MPSPAVAGEEGPEDDGGERTEEREDAGSERTSERSWEKREWSEAEWRQWHSYYAWGATPSGGGGGGSVQGNGPGPSSSLEGSAAPTAPRGSQGDPWWTSPGGDPWQGGDDRRGGSGGHDKIQVPEYSGEDDRDGVKAKGYIRKVDAWRRVTRLARNKQALMLYNSLSGRAWRDAEELDLSVLDADNGVEIFISWIQDKYMDREVTKVGRYMSDFFKVLKKGSNQDIRDFNQEFDRQVSRMKEVGCSLPDTCLAWWYVDKMRLDNATELNLLASVGNLYSLSKLQDAAIIQDRMSRRLWERRHDGDRRTEDKKKGHQALMASMDDEGEMEDRGPLRPRGRGVLG